MGNLANLISNKENVKITATKDGKKDYINIHLKGEKDLPENYLVVDYQRGNYYLVGENERAREILRNYFLRYIEKEGDLAKKNRLIVSCSQDIMKMLLNKYDISYEMESPAYGSAALQENEDANIMKIAAIIEDNEKGIRGEDDVTNDITLVLYRDINNSKDVLLKKGTKAPEKIAEVTFDFYVGKVEICVSNDLALKKNKESRTNLIDYIKEQFVKVLCTDSDALEEERIDSNNYALVVDYKESAQDLLKRKLGIIRVPLMTRKQQLADEEYYSNIKNYNEGGIEGSDIDSTFFGTVDEKGLRLSPVSSDQSEFNKA